MAIKRLEDRYLNPDSVKHSILQAILNFKCKTGHKFNKALSAITQFANNLEEMKTVHNIPIGADCLCKELLREICFFNLPSTLKVGLIDECKVNYPSID